MMDRIIARQVRRDPLAVQRAKIWLTEAKSKSEKPEWWVDEWLNILDLPTNEIARFVTSRGAHARRLSSASPFYYPEIGGFDFSDIEWRRRLWKMASRSLMLAHARCVEGKHEKGREANNRGP